MEKRRKRRGKKKEKFCWRKWKGKKKKIIQKLGKGEISNKLVMINKCVTQQVTA